MKINIVSGFFLPMPPVRGGATEKIWDELARRLVRAGHEVTIYSRDWPDFPAEESTAGVRYVRLRGADHTASLARNLWRDFRWGLRVGPALRPADVTICNTVMLPVWLRRRHPRAGRVVSVIARMPKGQARFYGQVDLLLSLSPAVTEALRRQNRAIGGRIERFPFPIDHQQQAEAAAQWRRPTAGAAVTIGYIGRLHPEKGISLLLAAAARLARALGLPDWRLRLLGPVAVEHGGGGEAWLEALVARHGPDLRGRLEVLAPEFDPARLARRYAELDVFCYPSVAEAGETFGVAVAEAMAAGCAPVVSRLDCFRELVIPGRTGLVFDHRGVDPAGLLAAALEQLLRDQPARIALAAQAQAHARQFDYAAVSELLTSYLTALVPPSAPPLPVQVRG